ncbi:hypothetical protein QWI17_10760 [Gilvimarinus sp. SDUM040013]|uniref:DUF2383 domain-containing protein n=1 Tax=Gilvimarinus gilvus TaxID=3058038 RepID=A0ABU4S2E4_9GAMM|nr:hypothetical protein [Gilvimarinus sp. SDUM040013]MDO3386319.1 hypothetical protein [Gilvimarinus sp. SDUM040013]MDX6850023.1 hypothetical protein [Gilvimarinus sp. SDUM040013]
MSVLRNDVQVALNDLHVALLESADHYRYAAEFVTCELASELFKTLAEARDLLASEAEEAIRARGDLPSVPDPDRETGEQLLQRLEAFFSADEAADVMAQGLEREAEFEQLLNAPQMQVIDKNYPSMRRACLQSIDVAREKLNASAAH